MRDSDALAAATVDAFGTTLELRDPVPRLRTALAERGIRRSDAAVAAAFAAEAAHYVPRAHLGRDAGSLAALRRECVGVFLAELSVRELDPAEFAPTFVEALEFRALAGAPQALARLRAAGLALACVANWDSTLPDALARAGLEEAFDVVVSSAEAGAPKPDPRPFRLALERLGVEPAQALHIGDDEVDRVGAAAAGLAFEPVPLATLPARLGLAG
ncbi:MAG: HAD-IA family hydrolase [Thermoleophilia bacterium]|nr:HAD-IA family hydrolase [Thermoleophilia bacterium]